MRSLVRMGGILLVFGMLVVVGKSLSEPKAPAVPKSRVALVNLSQLLKGYAKSARVDMENKKALVRMALPQSMPIFVGVLTKPILLFF